MSSAVLPFWMAGLGLLLAIVGLREGKLPFALVGAGIAIFGAITGWMWWPELRARPATWRVLPEGLERVRGSERRVVRWSQIRSVRAVCRDKRTLEGHIELNLGAGMMLRSSAHVDGGDVRLYRSTLFAMDVPDARGLAAQIEAHARVHRR